MLNAQHNCRKNDIEMTFKSDSTVQNQTKNVVCLTKKKTSHSFKKKKNTTHTSPPSSSQITESAVFTLIFSFIYTCVQMCAIGEMVCPSTCVISHLTFTMDFFFYPAAARYSQDDMA